MTRRMFSDEITGTDAFLDMPSGSQLLYFHLGMEADDDGFIANPRVVMRSVGSSEDEMKILIAKKFLMMFEDGVVVIKHWRINNQLRKDRYRETKYLTHKDRIFLKENGAYTMSPEKGKPMPRGHILPSGNQMATERQPSIGKVRIGKDSIYTDDFEKFWSEYPRKVSKKTAWKSWGKLEMTNELYTKIMASLKTYCTTDQWTKDDGKFIPQPATWINQERWNDEVKSGKAKVGGKFDAIKSKTI